MDNVVNVVTGNSYQLRGTFRTVQRVITDPTTVSLRVQKPSGTITTYTYSGAQIVKEAVGIYTYDLTVDEAGLWKYRFIGTGTVIATNPEDFYATEALP